jgi:hypothetical protein
MRLKENELVLPKDIYIYINRKSEKLYSQLEILGFRKNGHYREITVITVVKIKKIKVYNYLDLKALLVYVKTDDQIKLNRVIMEKLTFDIFALQTTKLSQKWQDNKSVLTSFSLFIPFYVR